MLALSLALGIKRMLKIAKGVENPQMSQEVTKGKEEVLVTFKNIQSMKK